LVEFLRHSSYAERPSDNYRLTPPEAAVDRDIDATLAAFASTLPRGARNCRADVPIAAAFAP
jgi:hypothetical protein